MAYTPHELDTLTPQDSTLYDLYIHSVRQYGALPSFNGPLASRPTPHLDRVLSSVSGLTDIKAAFATLYRAQLQPDTRSRPLPLVSAGGRVAVISALIREGYPASMHHFANPDAIAANLSNPTAAGFSFIVLGQANDGSPHYQAACTAYVAASKVNPDGPQVLYLDDLAVRPRGQSSLLGILAFREVLTRATTYNQPTVEFRARRKTSGKGFRGPVMARVLRTMGYESTDHGVVATYGEEPNIEYSHLIEVTKI